MSSFSIYLVSLALSIWAVTIGKKQIRVWIVPVLGWTVLAIDILVPVISFAAGFVDGMKAAG